MPRAGGQAAPTPREGSAGARRPGSFFGWPRRQRVAAGLVLHVEHDGLQQELEGRG